jgi:peptidoglycan hydrolase CwlO-like protein
MEIASQSPVSPPNQTYPDMSRLTTAVENISADLERINRSVELFNKNWSNFTGTFSSNQGLRLNERQQKLLFALEVLNRTEQSLANLQRTKLDHAERRSRYLLQLASITDDLLPESIDRYVAFRGTINADQIKAARIQVLTRESKELQQTLLQITREIDSLDREIVRVEVQIRSLRSQIFGQVEAELSDL